MASEQRINRNQAARILGCSKSSVRRFVLEGRISPGTLEKRRGDNDASEYTFDAGDITRFAATFAVDKDRSRRAKRRKPSATEAVRPATRSRVVDLLSRGMNVGEIMVVTGASEATILRCDRIRTMTPAQLAQFHEQERIAEETERANRKILRKLEREVREAERASRRTDEELALAAKERRDREAAEDAAKAARRDAEQARQDAADKSRNEMVGSVAKAAQAGAEAIKRTT